VHSNEISRERSVNPDAIMYGAPPMATTTTSEPTKHEPIPYAEHDKLGPLSKSAILDNELELRKALVAEFSGAADAARSAAAAVDRGAATAVHDYRKALRRARAILSLVEGALPKSERRAVRGALREARRALGSARDHAVAPETLSQLPLAADERETANKLVVTAGDAMPAIAEVKQLLAEGAARAAAQVEALEAALPPALAWDVVLDGVRGVYDQARRARKAAKNSKRAFHTWRRRSKELTYQLELLAGYAGAATTALHREIEGITDTQGPAVDLIMLRDFVRTHGQALSPEAFAHLVGAIDGQLADAMKLSRRAGRDAYARRPRKFTKRVAKLVHRDLSPVEEPEEIHGD
jgi:CHAD domain-containing protein